MGGRRPSSPLRRAAPLLAFAIAVALALVALGQAHAALGAPASLRQLVAAVPGLALGRLPPALDRGAPPPLLELAQTALPMAAAWLLAALLWLPLRNPARLWRARVRGDHLVIAGDGAMARLVAAAEIARGRSVLLWTREPRAGEVRRLAHAAAVVPRHDDVPAALSLARARAVLVLEEKSEDAAALAEALRDTAAPVRDRGDPLDIIARVDDFSSRRALEPRLENPGERAHPPRLAARSRRPCPVRRGAARRLPPPGHR